MNQKHPSNTKTSTKPGSELPAPSHHKGNPSKTSFAKYQESVHLWGRISLVAAILLFVSYPLYVSIAFDAFPGWMPVLQGLMSVAPVFWIVGVIEAITFGPMLGAAGSYVGFITGNLTAMKVPAALNAMSITDTKPNTEEGELVSTIAIATSSIVTTVVLFVGMLLLLPLTPVLKSAVLKPAFDNILPALFGALAVVFVSKNWKIAVAPIVVMVSLFLVMPKLASAVSILVPISALITVVAARILYKKGKL